MLKLIEIVDKEKNNLYKRIYGKNKYITRNEKLYLDKYQDLLINLYKKIEK